MKLTNCPVAVDPARTALAGTAKTENENTTLNAGNVTANELAMTATATVIVIEKGKDPRTVIVLATGTEENGTGNALAETALNPPLTATTPLVIVRVASNATTRTEGHQERNSTPHRTQLKKKTLTL